ncbi:MAG TPA: patatin-like phospholipase family protein [Candidatus Bathyarchaeia archaeon]|nr:patatin-like phospholipase family protein [Candidatus Bathyarchaeia archaeon]
MSSNKIENVLVLQGGGSLGAFGCGVFKALTNKNIKIDIVAGTSIGGINAAIIAGSVNNEHPEWTLEEFWLELGENSVNLTHPVLEWIYDKSRERVVRTVEDLLPATEKVNSLLSTTSSILYGNDKFFVPRWRVDYMLKDPQYFDPSKWTYIYDHNPLVKTLEKYIDYNKLQPDGHPNARLIMTAVNVLTSQPLTFDSSKQKITPKHILATSAYPSDNFPWVELEEGVYAWDGALLSNTPFSEVIDASPVVDKRLFFVENYPKEIEKLPDNLAEVQHRARDIMFSNKSQYQIKMSKVITRYLKYIEEIYQIIDKNIDPTKIDKKQLERIRRTYTKIKRERGAEIKNIVHITRDEPFPRFYENTDFSLESIKNSIKQGESKTNTLLEKIL